MRNTFISKHDRETLSAICAHLTITCSGINDQGFIGRQYTCEGANIHPSLDIAGIPTNANSLAITLIDPDASGPAFIHWIAWNIPILTHIREARAMEAEGMNDFRTLGYRGPCPSYGTHHYIFRVFALDALLDLHGTIGESELKTAMKGHILGFGKLTGLYKRE